MLQCEYIGYNVIEVIRPFLNFFLQKDYTHTKNTKPLTANNKKKNAHKKNLKGY